MRKQGKNTGLKIVILLLVLIIPILITVFVLQQNLDSDLKKGSVSSLTLIHGEDRDEVKEGEDLDFFIALTQKGEVIAAPANPLSEYRKCEAVFHKLNRDVSYSFYLSDSVHDCIYSDPDGKLYLIPEEDAAKLLAHPLIGGFAVSYASYPTVTLTQGGKTFGPEETAGRWVYAKTDDGASYEEISEKAEETVILPAGEAFRFHYSLEPDFCSVILQSEKGEILYSGDPKAMEPLALETDEKLGLIVKCDWYQEKHEEYEGSLTYTFDVFYDVATECSIDRETVSPGELITLTIAHSSSEDIAVNPSFATEKVQKMKTDGVWSILIPVAVNATPGTYSVMVLGSDVEENFAITVRAAS